MVRTLRSPLLALAAALVVAGCGNRALAPAAVVDGRAISQDELQTELDLQLSDPRLAQQVEAGLEEKTSVTRDTLASLIRLEVAREYADGRHITVSAADIDQELQDTIAQVGGQAAFDRIVQDRKLSPADVRHLLAEQVLFRKVRDDVVARLSPPGSGPDQDIAFQRWLVDRVAQAEVSVNPRFGRFDPATGNVLPLRSTADLG